MLANLKKALDGKGITVKAYAAVLGVSERSAWNKINEETALTYPEAMMNFLLNTTVPSARCFIMIYLI